MKYHGYQEGHPAYKKCAPFIAKNFWRQLTQTGVSRAYKTH